MFEIKSAVVVLVFIFLKYNGFLGRLADSNYFYTEESIPCTNFCIRVTQPCTQFAKTWYTMFVTINRVSFHLWLKENLVKHQKVSKYYECFVGQHSCFSVELVFRKRTLSILANKSCLMWLRLSLNDKKLIHE